MHKRNVIQRELELNEVDPTEFHCSSCKDEGYLPLGAYCSCELGQDLKHSDDLEYKYRICITPVNKLGFTAYEELDELIGKTAAELQKLKYELYLLAGEYIIDGELQSLKAGDVLEQVDSESVLTKTEYGFVFQLPQQYFDDGG